MYFFHWAYTFVIVFTLVFANVSFLVKGKAETVPAEKEAELLCGYVVGLPSSQTLLDSLNHLNFLQLT